MILNHLVCIKPTCSVSIRCHSRFLLKWMKSMWFDQCVFLWFGLQMEELLKEVTLSERRKKLLDSFVQQITDLLESVPETPVVEVSMQCVMQCSSELTDFSIIVLSFQLGIVFSTDSFSLLSSYQTCLGYRSRESMSRTSWFLRRLKASSTWSHLTLWIWLAVILWEPASNQEFLLI